VFSVSQGSAEALIR